MQAFALPEEFHCRGDIWNGTLKDMTNAQEMRYYPMCHQHRFQPGVCFYRPKLTVERILFLDSLDESYNGPIIYELVFSTYAGGKNWEHARDVCADKDGNVYMVGGTSSADFPTTPGAYDRTFDATGKEIGGAGLCDAFIMKFSAEGKLLWSTRLGGPNYDRAYGVEVDAKGYVYVAGRAGPGFPVTEGAFQAAHGGGRDAFVAVLSPDLSRLLYSTFMGGKADDVGRSGCLGPDGSLCIAGAANGTGWPVRNASQPKFAGTNDPRWGNGDCILARFRPAARAKS